LHTARAAFAQLFAKRRCLQEGAAARLLGSLGGGGVEDSADGLLEDGLETSLVERRALNVLDGADGLAHVETLLEGDGGEALLGETGNGLRILTKIELGADQEEGRIGAVVLDLGVPLGLHVLERSGRDDGEANEEDIGLGVGQRAETVIILLASGIPQAKVNRLSVDHNVGRVVVEHRGDVLARESVGGVRDQEARLTDGTVTDYDALDGLHVWRCLGEGVFYFGMSCKVTGQRARQFLRL